MGGAGEDLGDGLILTTHITNRSILSAVEAHYKDPSHPYPGDDSNQILYELTPYLESAGINDPLSKVRANGTMSQWLSVVLPWLCCDLTCRSI